VEEINDVETTVHLDQR